MSDLVDCFVAALLAMTTAEALAMTAEKALAMTAEEARVKAEGKGQAKE